MVDSGCGSQSTDQRRLGATRPAFSRKGPQAKRRLRLEGILWIHRTGAPWRDLPACFGKWATVQSCFYRWDDSGLWARLWQRMRDTLGADHEALYIDSTSIPAHRHSAGAQPAQSEQAIGVSRGGRGTKVHAVCDALGYPVAVELSGAQESDVTRARTMLEDQQAQHIVADLGYDCERLRAQIAAQGAEPVIAGRKNRTVPVEYDKHWYKSRHLVENFFCRVADHRRVATRYEKTARRFLAMVMLSCILVWLKF